MRLQYAINIILLTICLACIGLAWITSLGGYGF